MLTLCWIQYVMLLEVHSSEKRWRSCVDVNLQNQRPWTVGHTPATCRNLSHLYTNEWSIQTANLKNKFSTFQCCECDWSLEHCNFVYVIFYVRIIMIWNSVFPSLLCVPVSRISDVIRKSSVPQWGIKPQSLIIQVSIITTRPTRHLIAVTFTSLRTKHVLKHFELRDHIGHQM